MHVSPVLRETGTYPFVKLDEAKRRLRAEGVELIDFGKGDPREPTDPRIRRALADVLQLPLLVENSFLPDLDAVHAETWARAAIVWINYPNNPTGAVAPLDFLARLAELSREHDFLVASDEAYTELWFDEPPHSALEVRELGRS